MAEWIARRPGRVAAAVALLVVLAGALAGWRLGIQTDRAALIGDQHDYNRVFARLRGEFGDLEAMIVLIKAAERGEAERAAAGLASALEADPAHFPRVFWRVPPDALRGKALLFLAPGDLDEIAGRLEFGRPALLALRSEGLGAFYEQIARELGALARGEARPAGAPTFLPRFVDELEAALDGAREGPPPWEAWIPPAAVTGRDGYTWTGDGRLVVLVQPPPGEGEAAVAALRAVLGRLEPDHAQVEFALTGEPVLEADELITFRGDALRATLVSLIGVTLLLWLAMRRLLGPLLAVCAVAAAVLLTLGAATIWPGHLNVISLALCALMLGLGIDYAIHWTSRYDAAREAGAVGAAALRLTTAGSGRAIAAGALTTALGFLATLFTEVEGIREFGVVASLGVLFSLCSCLVLLPALTVLADRGLGGRARPRSGWRRSPLPQALDLLVERRPKTILALGLGFSLAVCGAAFPGGALRYDPNLLALQAAELPSVRLADELLHDPALSGMFAAIVIDDVATLAEIESRVAALPSVGETRSILDLVPAEQPLKLLTLARIREAVETLPLAGEPRDLAAPLGGSLARLARALREVGDAALSVGRGSEAEAALALGERLDHLASRLGEANPVEAARLSAHGATLRARLAEALERLHEECAREPLTRADLPPALRERFVGRSGKLLLRVYPREAVWAEAPLARFVAEVQSVAPDAGGVPIQFYESDRLIRRGFVRAGQFALVFVVLFLVVHFRSVRRPLIATLTLLVGASWALGALLLCGWTLNPANLLALPLTFGIGVDYAIHVIHRERESTRGASLADAPALVATASGRAVILSALTTAVGFGALTLSAHRGVASIGLTVSIGVLGCLAASLLICPALLRIAGGPSYPPRLVGLPGPKTGPGGVVRRPDPEPPRRSSDDESEPT